MIEWTADRSARVLQTRTAPILSLDFTGPTAEQIASMPTRLQFALFGLAYIPAAIWYAGSIPSAPARPPEPRGPRTALGSGVVARSCR